MAIPNLKKLPAGWCQTTLPSSVKTKGGAVFDPRKLIWAYRDGLISVNLNFEDLAISPELRNSLKATLVWYAMNRSAEYLGSVYREIRSFLGNLAAEANREVSEIAGIDVLNQRDNLGYNMKQVSSVLRKWASLGHPGLGDDVVSTLNKIHTKSPETGIAVMTLDPNQGPFSPIEQKGIQDALNDAYGRKMIDEETFLLAWLFIALGSRPIQLASLKVCDILRSEAPDGTQTYLIQVPRAKQRNASPRDAFKTRHLMTQLGSPLFAYAQRVKERFTSLLSDPKQAPLFPAEPNSGKTFNDSGWAQFHRSSLSVGTMLKKGLNKLEVVSERTGLPLNITPIRFRRTFGTNAAQEGHGLLVIAELLDHSGTESAGVYVAATPELAGRLEKGMALHMAPLAQAFKGHLIEDESQAVRGADPSSRILDLRIDQSAKPMGSCGQLSFCGFAAPVACYTCKSFEPWLDGPHEAVLDHLLTERDRMPDNRIAAVNDRTILAVAQVVKLCRDKKENTRG